MGRRNKSSLRKTESSFNKGGLRKTELSFNKGGLRKMQAALAGILVACAAAYIYYGSVIGLVAGIPVGIYVYRINLRRLEERYKADLQAQFRTMLQSMTGTLEAGYAIQNSFLEAGKDCAGIHSEKCEIVYAISRMKKRFELNESLGEVLNKLSLDFQLREMKDFAEVINVASRTGGNITAIIRETAEKIADSIELKEELGTAIAARQLEQRLMTCMPGVMVIFLKVTSPGLLDVLFGNPFGVMVMTIMLSLNVLADYIGKRIVGRLSV